ncbi:MAG: hypothetical protein AAF560_21840 [Acidobacteriota bacterium]
MNIESAVWKQWLDQDVDGELSAGERKQLETVLETDPEARADQRGLTALHQAMQEDRIAVRPGFSEQVMTALPQTWWEREASAGLPRWALPLAMMLVMALGAALMLGGSAEVGRIAGVGMTLLDFMQATFLAGAGMLFATWRGFGFGLEAMIAESGLSLLAMAGAVLSLNVLFFSMLRRRRLAEQTADADGQQSEG